MGRFVPYHIHTISILLILLIRHTPSFEMARWTSPSEYRALVAKLLAETLRQMSLDVVKIIHGYVRGYPTATVGAFAERLLTVGLRRELRNSNCYAVACDLNDRIWIANSTTVKVFCSEGKFLHNIAFSGLASGIAFGPAGDAYVSDYHRHCIRVHRSDGNLVREFGYGGSKPGQLFQPSFLALDSQEGLLFVTDNRNDRVQMFTLDGTFVRILAESPIVKSPEGVAVHAADKVVAVADEHKGCVQVWPSVRAFHVGSGV